MEKSILDDVFGKTEEEVETFMDAIKSQVTVPDKYSRMAEDRPDMVSAPEFTDQISGSIRIQSGKHGDDHVWHISCDPRKQWKVSLERVCYAVANVMNGVIPSTVRVNIFLPYADWDVQEITFKAIDLGNCWNVSDKVISDMNIKLMTILNTLV